MRRLRWRSEIDTGRCSEPTDNKLTNTEKTHLLDLIALVGERDMPSYNTEAMLVRRSGLNEETVAWGIAVLYNEGLGWLEHDDNPQTGERGYYLGDRFDAGDMDQIYKEFLASPKTAPNAEGGIIVLDKDDDDPDDEWAGIDDDDDPDDHWEAPVK